MAELVYAHDLKSCLARDVGSTPTSGTVFENKINAPIAQLVEQIPLKDKVVGSIPTGCTRTDMYYAGVAKLADALALGASEVTHGGSSPLPGTKQIF